MQWAQHMGLTRRQAQEKLEQQGANLLRRGRKISAVRIFAGQFKDGMVLVLLLATGLAAFLGQREEALSIAAILLLNAMLGFFQEWRCEKTLEALAGLAAPLAHVRREGLDLEIPASSVVEGDLLLLKAGDRIAADAVLLEALDLSCDESLLTGESAAVFKRAARQPTIGKTAGEAMVFMGCSVLAGRALAQVSATGMNTEMGSIAGMLETIAEEPTPLAKRLDQVGRAIALGCVLICALVAGFGIWRGEDPFSMLLTGISLAVAAVPEGLPAIVTISLALAVRRILRRKALMKRLHAVETLGCATVICADKTGTLTQNRMTARTAYTLEGSCDLPLSAAGGLTMQRLLECAAFCNDAQPGRRRIGLLGKERREFAGEPTEAALLEAASDAGIRLSDFSREGEQPFDSGRKRMSVWGLCADGTTRAFVKGAPELLLPRCTKILAQGGAIPLDGAMRGRALAAGESMARDALRVIGFAMREGADPRHAEEDLVFLGLIGLYDPPRPEVPAAIAACKAAGIRPVMITGDHAATARSIALQIGLMREGDAVITGELLDRLNDEEMRAICRSARVFARVTPAHKLRLVRAMKQNGEIVAMTGDGVNDAPAVKEATIGIAMGEGGADVTREAAQVILLDNNFATIVAAVEEGRVIYRNIRRFLRYLLSCNTGEVVAMLAGMLMGMPVLLTPIQLLLVNLVTDGLPAISLGVEPAEPHVMRVSPRRPDASVFSDGLTGKILLRGCLIGLCTVGVFSLFAAAGEPLALCRTAALLALVFTQLFHVFECRSETRGILALNPFGNPWLLAAGCFSALCTAASVWHPLGWRIFGTAPLSLRQFGLVLGCAFLAPLLSSVALHFARTRAAVAVEPPEPQP